MNDKELIKSDFSPEKVEVVVFCCLTIHIQNFILRRCLGLGCVHGAGAARSNV